MDGKQLAVLLAFIGAAALLFGQQNTTPLNEFDSWKKTHGISFESEFENAYRERIFIENIAKINAHNAKTGETYTMGVNQFTHLTQEEFAAIYLTLQVPVAENVETIELSTANTADEIDWTTKGVINSVKNQGQCGSCWAFSTTGSIEPRWKIQKSDMKNLAEQELVDCSAKYGNHGCNGGLMTYGTKYIIENGISATTDYPYTARQGTCKTDVARALDKGAVKQYVTLGRGDSQMKAAITEGPVSIAVDASRWSTYHSGIFNNCGTQLNHGVTAVGYGKNAQGQEFWKVRNSWGTTWGESGYIELAMGNTCGCENMAGYPTF